ncbi:50S ribosome-binding GTPase [Synechocystis sp. B12]|nr:50S ribosome-binding GTPase [Synechocystis sp. B12]
MDEAEIADILTQLRRELPTTEALLIGKPQSGKSSLVRGLTGASAAIVGQGFQPHTQNTARYAYPSPELPLLVFTDTVGLGDLGYDTQSLIEELKAELAAPGKLIQRRKFYCSPSKLPTLPPIPSSKLFRI